MSSGFPPRSWPQKYGPGDYEVDQEEDEEGQEVDEGEDQGSDYEELKRLFAEMYKDRERLIQENKELKYELNTLKIVNRNVRVRNNNELAKKDESDLKDYLDFIKKREELKKDNNFETKVAAIQKRSQQIVDILDNKDENKKDLERSSGKEVKEDKPHVHKPHTSDSDNKESPIVKADPVSSQSVSSSAPSK